MSYRQKKQVEKEPELPPRLKLIKQAYDDAHIEYILTGEDYHEIEFYDVIKKVKPQVFITSIYRILTEPKNVLNGTSKEVLVYWKQQTAEKYNGENIQDDRLHGLYYKPVTRPTRNVEGETTRWDKVYETPFFLIPFSPKTVDEIIKESATAVTNFYVGYASPRGGNLIDGDPFRIFNLDDFKNGTFQELIDMGTYNYSTREPALENWRAEGESIKKQNKNAQIIARSQRVV